MRRVGRPCPAQKHTPSVSNNPDAPGNAGIPGPTRHATKPRRPENPKQATARKAPETPATSEPKKRMANQPLSRLTYASTANFDTNSGSGNIDLEIGRILRACKINNPKQGIGGVLHYGYGYFFQGIEGPRDAVNRLYERITADDRHRDLQVLSTHDTETRFFPDWSMKYVPLEKDVEALLKRHGMRKFNPYRFDDAIIDELIRTLVEGRAPLNEPDQNYGRGGSLLKRIFGRR
jgi:hypothetical protein